METFFFFGTPWVAPIGFIIQTLIMIAIIWFPKTRKPDKEYYSKYIKAIRGFPMALILFFGVMYIDVFVSVVMLGGYSPGTWKSTYPCAFLALALGIEWISMAALVSPNVKTLLSTIAYVVAYIMYTKIYMPSTRDAWSILGIIVVMIVICVVHVLMVVVEGIAKRVSKRFQGDKPLWNIRARFKRVFNVPVNVIVWALVLTEALLSFAGYSIITVFL
nr:hypothetical protein [Candidatus Sigynarchaeum springense]MDO8117400.1 hypothetical protein [Candidatus Sigynarchaeota archaeon]